MKKFQISFLLLLVFAFISGCGVKGTSTRVDVKLDTFWESDPSMPSGGIIFGRGEGSNGIFPDREGVMSTGKITVSLTKPSDVPSGPVELPISSITFMDITVITETGETKHFGSGDITTAAYFIGFEHTWSGGPTVTYIIKNIYTGGW